MEGSREGFKDGLVEGIIDGSLLVDELLGAEEGPHQMMGGFLVAVLGGITLIFQKAQNILNFLTPIGVTGANVFVNGCAIDR